MKPATFAPVTVCSRKMPRRTSGSGTRVSQREERAEEDERRP